MTYLLGHRASSSDTHVIAIGGEVDMNAAPDLRTAIERAIETGVKLLVIDLTEARFIDSTAIGILVAARARLREQDGSLEIVCVEPNLMRIFEVIGLDREMHIHASCDSALEAFAGAR